MSSFGQTADPASGGLLRCAQGVLPPTPIVDSTRATNCTLANTLALNRF
jgi:hypothetical protein